MLVVVLFVGAVLLSPRDSGSLSASRPGQKSRTSFHRLLALTGVSASLQIAGQRVRRVRHRPGPRPRPRTPATTTRHLRAVWLRLRLWTANAAFRQMMRWSLAGANGTSGTKSMSSTYLLTCRRLSYSLGTLLIADTFCFVPRPQQELTTGAS